MDEDKTVRGKVARKSKGTPAAEGPLERELRETLERYESIFSATHDVLYDLNFHTSRVVWNEALFTQYGYDKSESVDRLEWWTAHIHPDDALGVEHAVTALLESTENNWNYEYRFQKADGQYADIRDRGIILRSKSGEPQRIIGSFLDITRQKQLDRAKDEFSSLISHQLRTPLTVIQIYSDLLAEGAFGRLTQKQARELKKIHNSSVKLIELVNDILAISSVELQPTKLRPTPILIDEFMRKCVEDVAKLAENKQIRISLHLEDGVKPLKTYAKDLEQVIHNLLTNAIRYSPAGTGRIAVTVAAKDAGCLFSVKDNGIGIPVADQPYIFDRFYRGVNAVNTETQGTGLGLYYVSLVTKTFGAKIWFTTVQNKGTTFSLYVPGS